MEEFIKQIATFAVKHGKTNNILPSLMISQAILESAGGRSELAVNANNLFGIKKGSGWNGEVYAVKTGEYDSQKRYFEIVAEFRKFPDYNGSFESLCYKYTHGTSWEKFNRYQAVVGEKDYRKATQAVRDAGYATDPNYPAKLNSIIEKYGLTKYDKEEIKSEPPKSASPPAKPKGDDNLKFSSSTLRKEAEKLFATKADKEKLVRDAVASGANKIWLEKLKNNDIEDGDILALIAVFTLGYRQK